MPGGLLGGGGQTQPAVYSQGANPAPYIPAGQQAADQQYQQLLSSMYGPYFAGQTPPQQNYPTAQSLVAGQVNPYLAGTTPPQQNYPLAQAAATNVGQTNPYAQAAVQSALQTGAGGDFLSNALLTGLGGTQGIIQNLAFNPSYQDIAHGYFANPYIGEALSGAQTGADIGSRAAQIASGQFPLISGLPTQLSGLAGQISQPIGSILNTAFDPQGALYQQNLQQIRDQANASAAMSGTAGSPYAAGLSNDAIRNFQLGWENQQLGREATGLGAAGQAAGTAGNLYGMIPGIASSGLNLGANAANLAAGAAGLPSSVYTGQLGQEAAGMNNQLAAAMQGVTGLNQLGSGYGTGLNMLSGAGMLPYQTSAGIAGQGIPALQSATNLGLQQYTLPQSILQSLQGATNLGQQQYVLPQTLLGDLGNYLGIGQGASSLAAAEGNLGFNQNRATAGGLGLLGMLASPFLFGSQGLTGALGLNPVTGLVGGIGSLLGGGGGGAINYNTDL